MEVTGRLIQILPLQSGESKNGVWKKQDIILELNSDAAYPKKLCVSMWNDKIISDIMEGSILKVSFEIESREYNNKWYTNIKAWKVEEVSELGQTPVPKDAKKDFFLDAPDKEKNFPHFDSDLPFDNEEIMPF